MTEKLDLYKCNICGNFVEVVFSGEGELVCCGQPMEKLVAKKHTEEMLDEKHVPVLEKTENGYDIRVGSVIHPMEENHYITFIEAISNDKKYVKRKYLEPHEQPILNLKCSCDKVVAREFCNIHGLWIKEE